MTGGWGNSPALAQRDLMAAPRTRAKAATGANIVETPGVLDAEIVEGATYSDDDVLDAPAPVIRSQKRAVVKPLDGIYRFKLRKGPFTGKRTFLRLDTDEAVIANGGKRRLTIENYEYETTSEAIYDDLMRQIVAGRIRDITQEIVVMVPCPFGCGETFRSNKPDELNRHVQEVHINPQIEEQIAAESEERDG